MITLQHTAVSVLALGENKCRTAIPWVLLPDAIRMYAGPRPASHFETTPEGTDVSWMVFPDGDTLRKVNQNNFAQLVEYYVSPKAPKCVIGEQTILSEFDVRNYSHPYFHYIRTHLLQDCILDETLRKKMVDVTGRFDDKFVINHDRSIVIDGAELRKQVAAFEEVGFLHLAGKVYRKTGVVLDQEWFERNVHQVLLDSCYPSELAENTYRFMKIPPEYNERIQRLDFTLTAKDKARVIITDDLERILDEMYSDAYLYTASELSRSML